MANWAAHTTPLAPCNSQHQQGPWVPTQTSCSYPVSPRVLPSPKNGSLGLSKRTKWVANLHSYVPLGLYGPGVVWERPGLNKKGRRRHQMAKNDPKMTIFRPRESGATPNLGSCGSGYGGYLGGIHLPTGRAHQEGSTRPDTAPPGAMCVGVGVFFGVFTRRYVGTQAGSMDQGGSMDRRRIPQWVYGRYPELT